MDLPFGFPGLVLVVVALFFASTFLTARTLRREIRDAREKGKPLPQVAAWWPAVVKREAFVVGAGLLGLGLGLAAFALGAILVGRALVLVGVGAFCYAAHARILVAALRAA